MTKREVADVCVGTAKLVLVLLGILVVALLALSIHWKPQALKNQAVVARLLTTACPELSADAPSRIERIRLGNGTALVPGMDRAVSGYILRPRVSRSGFTIAADPVEVGKTGLFFFFREETGMIRYEVDKPAGKFSKPWSIFGPEGEWEKRVQNEIERLPKRAR